MQLVFAENMRRGGRALIVAPLGVTTQTIREAARIGLECRYLTKPEWSGLGITNYERIGAFVGAKIDALVLDESSILKSFGGKTRSLLTERFQYIDYRLCCTATPAPNDLIELGNHSQFLGYMTAKAMQATFFINRAQTGTRWELKKHAIVSFYRWLASWAMFLRDPGDIGYFEDQDKFNLPDLFIHPKTVRANYKSSTQLFPTIGGISGRLEARKKTIEQRVATATKMIQQSKEKWVIWCGLNAEGRELKKQLGSQCVLVEGVDAPDKKIQSWLSWEKGIQTMISKPSIFGFGMNFQFCHNVLFLGLGDSYEQYYQAIRRCWRFGQESSVNVYIVVSDVEGPIVQNIKRKERTAKDTMDRMVSVISTYEVEELSGGQKMEQLKPEVKTTADWELANNDCVDWIGKTPDNQYDLSIFSPPFLDLYAYTDSDRDIGNSRGSEEFFNHYGFVIDGLLRTTKPGRLCCTHVSQIPAIKYIDGFIGLKDFRGRVVSEYVDRGWIYHGEVVIDKDPQAQAIRTKSKGLLFVSLKRDSSWLRPALADYILVFRKPGENQTPIKPIDISHEDWISWARPVWYNINETRVLQFRGAKGEDDTKHICPLQLDVIERCIKLWSNPGEVICSPFAGIGSEGYVALKLNRKFAGCELKKEYYNLAKKNLSAASSQLPLAL
jgi:DNA modification methylase